MAVTPDLVAYYRTLRGIVSWPMLHVYFTLGSRHLTTSPGRLLIRPDVQYVYVCLMSWGPSEGQQTKL